MLVTRYITVIKWFMQCPVKSYLMRVGRRGRSPASWSLPLISQLTSAEHQDMVWGRERGGGGYWINLCMESVQTSLSKHWYSLNLNTDIRLCLPLRNRRRMPENWLPYRDILLVCKMPKVSREPHGISVFYRSLRTQRNGWALVWSITSCVTFLNVRMWRATLECLTSQWVPRVPGHFLLSQKFLF